MMTNTVALGIIVAVLLGAFLIASIWAAVCDGDGARACPKNGRRCIGNRCAQYHDCEVAK